MGEAKRLEHLWSGDFGEAYTERNATASEGRRRQWDDILDRWPARRVLEVGCNAGARRAACGPRRRTSTPSPAPARTTASSYNRWTA